MSKLTQQILLATRVDLDGRLVVAQDRKVHRKFTSNTFVRSIGLLN